MILFNCCVAFRSMDSAEVLNLFLSAGHAGFFSSFAFAQVNIL